MCQSTRREERGLVMLKYLGHGVIVRRGESAHLLAVLVMVHALQLIALLNSLEAAAVEWVKGNRVSRRR